MCVLMCVCVCNHHEKSKRLECINLKFVVLVRHWKFIEIQYIFILSNVVLLTSLNNLLLHWCDFVKYSNGSISKDFA